MRLKFTLNINMKHSDRYIFLKYPIYKLVSETLLYKISKKEQYFNV